MTHYRFASHIARFDLLDDGAHAHIVDLVALQPRLVHDAANRLARQIVWLEIFEIRAAHIERRASGIDNHNVFLPALQSVSLSSAFGEIHLLTWVAKQRPFFVFCFFFVFLR